MAQVQEERMTWARRCRLYARQRPVVLVIGAVVATLLIMALGAGVTGALGAAGADDGGVLVTRSDAGSSERGAAEVEHDDAASDDGVSGSESKPEKQEVIVVDVAGAVGAPSLVTLQADSRVGDAIEAAGGFAADADAARVNRAAKLQDGQQVYVPRMGGRAVVVRAPWLPMSERLRRGPPLPTGPSTSIAPRNRTLTRCQGWGRRPHAPSSRIVTRTARSRPLRTSCA